MSGSKMHSIPNGRYTMEMRSGKILKIDEGFTSLIGYSDQDVKDGIVFKQLVPNVEYDEIISELREKFINNIFTSYQHEMVTKDGGKLKVVSFVSIQNKLHEGHRVLEVGIAVIE